MRTGSIVKLENGIFRGPRLHREELEALQPALILNLENDHGAVCDEEVYCMSKNISFYNIRMSEIFPPSQRQLKEGVEIIQTARKPVYVHCLHGVDRTGFVIAAYRMIHQGWTLDKAYQECLDMGHHVFWYWYWKRSLIKLDKERRK